MKHIELETAIDGLQDFNCPHCDMPLDDMSYISKSCEVTATCPSCYNDFVVNAHVITQFTYSVSKQK